MVNGTLSKILYIGALLIVALCLAGLMFGTGRNDEVVAAVLSAALAFLFGSHVTPPNVAKISPGEIVTPKAGIPEGTRIVDRTTVTVKREGADT